MTLKRGKATTDIRKDLDKLSLKSRKTSSLSSRDQRKSITSSYGTGRSVESSGATESTEYELVTVESTDGLFAFEIMTVKDLAE